jgi:AcrR family transcriptional regulator
MANISTKPDWLRGLYYLFQTKEDVFLSLMQQKMTQWSDSFAKKMEAVAKDKIHIQTEEFVDILINSIDDKVFIKLLAILDDTLEQNIDFKRAVQHKTFLREKMIDLGRLIEAILPMLHQGEGMIILNQLFICFIGAYKV